MRQHTLDEIAQMTPAERIKLTFYLDRIAEYFNYTYNKTCNEYFIKFVEEKDPATKDRIYFEYIQEKEKAIILLTHVVIETLDAEKIYNILKFLRG